MSHELGTLRPRCWDCNRRPVEKQFDRCPMCQARYEFTGFQKNYPISEPSLREVGIGALLESEQSR